MNKKAFTLIELLVVTLTIAILAAIALPKYKTAVEKTNLTEGLKVIDEVYGVQKVREQRGQTATIVWDDLGIEFINKAEVDIAISGTATFRTKKFLYTLNATYIRGSRMNDVVSSDIHYHLDKYYADGSVVCTAVTSIGTTICNLVDSMND